MSVTEILREFAFPARNLTVLLSALFIFLMLKFAVWGGLLGLFLLFLVLPSLFHYLLRILDARSRGQEPGPLDAEDLMWYHAPWRLFMIVHLVFAGYALWVFGNLYQLPGVVVTGTLLAAVLPASLAVLAITRSPLQSLNPQAVGALIGRTGAIYWLLPTYLVLAAMVLRWLRAEELSGFFLDLFGFYLGLVFFSLTGAVVQPYNLHEEVDIYDPVEPDVEVVEEKLLKERTNVLTHAYGFISRDNRKGGFGHIEGWLREDPDPESAWAWFFDQMLRWEDKHPALLFGQSYISQLLEHGDSTTAVKVMMRCRLHNEAFVPLPGDMAAAAEAAAKAGNQELATLLRSRV
ncbi:MAG: hypothetical protein QNJ23_05765 [Woeseiaceae bacterium]|nr:hypothetical protein [Woeseiaceae bacterium]